jgi:hypothetical protein
MSLVTPKGIFSTVDGWAQGDTNGRETVRRPDCFPRKTCLIFPLASFGSSFCTFHHSRLAIYDGLIRIIDEIRVLWLKHDKFVVIPNGRIFNSQHVEV